MLLTAAHCTDGTLGKTIVTFEWFFDDAAPSNLPRAADDEGDGMSEIGYTGSYPGYYTGTAYTHPEYSGFTDLRNWNDVGVVVLDRPITGITPAKIAPLSYVQWVAQSGVNQARVIVSSFQPQNEEEARTRFAAVQAPAPAP